jgi:hypothetical protein
MYTRTYVVVIVKLDNPSSVRGFVDRIQPDAQHVVARAQASDIKPLTINVPGVRVCPANGNALVVAREYWGSDSRTGTLGSSLTQHAIL